ncbi:hypothetical protein D9757_009443 [Collybiopsis confluens]|uniref:RNase H type-1 domain-containing protein n=1 Tax=Collybiopsis confluens TaxID=2823264 RepID=A0A8H5HDF2_9AGAR|nr:hypothetical protein D9757_009443 [Collybiopsis confluens]
MADGGAHNLLEEILPRSTPGNPSNLAQPRPNTTQWHNYQTGRYADENPWGHIGNNISRTDPWVKVVEKIKNALALWKDIKLTLDGKMLVTQFELTSRCQFITAAQGMPDCVLTNLNKIMNKFIWNGERPRVSRGMLQKPATEGGKNLISLEDLRDAIGLMRLKSYLNFGKTRATWTYFADEMARLAINKEGERKLPNPTQRINPLLQNWDIVGAKVPAYLNELVKLSKKYGIKVEVRDPTLEVSKEMPAWYHIGTDPAKRQLNNVGRSKCLQENHEVTKTGDLSDIVARGNLREHNPLSNTCTCQDCETDRLYMCKKPADCTKHAERVLSTLLPKWNPRLKKDTISETVTNEETTEIFRAPAEPINLRDSFRVFTNAEEYTKPPTPTPREGTNADSKLAEIYISGASREDNSGGRIAGGGLQFKGQQDQDAAIKLPVQVPQTNDAAAIITATNALRKCNPDTEITLTSRAKAVTKNILKNIQMWEQRGYIGIPNASLLLPLVTLLKEHKATIRLRLVEKDHPDYNKIGGAHKLALEATNKQMSDRADLSTDKVWQIKGAQLSTMTQKLMYLGVRSLTFPKKRKSDRYETHQPIQKTYQKNLAQIRADVKSWTNRVVDNKDIWINCTKSKNATKEQNIWAWKAIHNTFWVGRKWLHCNGYEERATCSQAETWDLARKFLLQRSIQLPDPITLGLVLGAGAVTPRNGKNEKAPGASRLTEVVMREATALIWQLRNNHVIKQNGNTAKLPTKKEIYHQFLFRLNQRMQLDLTLMNQFKFGNKAIPKARVLSTWQGTIEVDEPPDDWTKIPGVLVGMGND